MKKQTIQMEVTVKPLPETATGFNITLITSEGSYISTQVFHRRDEMDVRQATAKFILDRLSAGWDESQTFDEPIIAAYVKPHGMDELYCFNLNDARHLLALSRLLL